MKSVVICGSRRFKREMREFARRLKELNVLVYEPHLRNPEDEWDRLPERYKEFTALGLTHDHFYKIKMADVVFIYNKDGYAGCSTTLEMGFAVAAGKPIFALTQDQELCRNVLFRGFAASPEELVKQLSGQIVAGVMSTKRCDNKSVGMLVWRDNKLLLIERKKPPFGFAPPAGHIDGDESFESAAKRELLEEVGLEAKNLELVFEGRKENPCRRGGTWHYWKVYNVNADGELNRSESETKQAGWYVSKEILGLAAKNEDYLKGKITEDEWQKSPGLEPVWYEIMKGLKIVKKQKIVICGSVFFANEMMEAKRYLENRGYEMVLPWGIEDFVDGGSLQEELYSGQRQQNLEGAKRKMEHNLIRAYYDEISQADAILVINKEKKGVQGYIGGNSFLEMGFAHILGKKIYCLNPLSEDMPVFYEEMVAMQPIVLNGDLSKISFEL